MFYTCKSFHSFVLSLKARIIHPQVLYSPRRNISRNHRIVGVGRDLWMPSSPIPLLSWGPPEPRAMITLLLSISTNGNFITSVGNLCQHSVTFTVKMFPDVQMKPPIFPFEPIVSCPVTEYNWKKALIQKMLNVIQWWSFDSKGIFLK